MHSARDVADLAPDQRAALVTRLRARRIGSVTGIPRAPRTRPIPASVEQERFWLLHQLAPTSTAYTIAAAMRMRGGLDRMALAGAVDDLVARHESLRTTFELVDGVVTQRIGAARDVLTHADLTGLSGEEAEAALAARLAEVTRAPFDLATGPVLRAELVRLRDDEHVLAMAVHHIACDGVSIALMSHELGALYAARRGDGPPLPPPSLQYADYADWQRARAASGEPDPALAYWRKRLADAPATTTVSADRPRPGTPSSSAGTYQARYPARVVKRVTALADEHGATPFMVLLAAVWVLLRAHTEHPVVCVGTPVANRSRPELAGTVGLLLNTLPLTARIEQHATFADVVRHARATVSEALTHQGVPFEQMVRDVVAARDRGHAPLFDVLFSMRPPVPTPAWPGVSATWLEVPGTGAKYDLAIEVEQTGDGLDVWFVYRDELYEPPTVARLAGRYGALLAALVGDPGRPLDEVDALAADERTLVLDTWNRTAEPEEPSVDRRFAEQVRATPDAVAVRTDTGELTYAELAHRVDVLADRLAGLPTGPEPVALVCCERGAELVVALLAALRAGVAYVPVAPGAPGARTASMLTGVDVVLTTRAAQPSLPAWPGPVLFADDLDGTERPATHDAVPDPGQAAYVLYTSGSTGRPKGVTITRRGFDNYVNWAARTYGHRPGEVSVVHTAISFDLTVTSLFPPLITGGTLRLLPESAGVDELAAAVSDGCGVLKLTPAHLRALDLLGLPPAARARVRCLVVGGEVLQWADVDRWRGVETIVNEYGPTEAVVGSCVHVVGDRTGATVPIGRPIANTRLYVLDDELRPAGIGEPGELYIGGAGVARGYRDQPGLTAERYVPDSFSGLAGERLYRTGDVVRRRHDGTLEYLGRRDQQVQIRGHRVEPAEIEAVLLAHPAVRQAAVTVVPG